MSRPPKNSPFQLLVEGPDDQFVVINLLKRHGYDFDNAAPLKAIHLVKGAMHAWLSWQDPSGPPPGRALEYGTLLHDTPEALRFVAWFSDLFQVKPTRKV